MSTTHLASRVMRPSILSKTSLSTRCATSTRSFMSSPARMETPSAALPVRKPVGAFRGGMFGFLSGSVIAGGLVYYYILEEYRVSNEMLTEDIFALQAATQRINTYVTELETKVDQLQKKK